MASEYPSRDLVNTAWAGRFAAKGGFMGAPRVSALGIPTVVGGDVLAPPQPSGPALDRRLAQRGAEAPRAPVAGPHPLLQLTAVGVAFFLEGALDDRHLAVDVDVGPEPGFGD